MRASCRWVDSPICLAVAAELHLQGQFSSSAYILAAVLVPSDLLDKPQAAIIRDLIGRRPDWDCIKTRLPAPWPHIVVRHGAAALAAVAGTGRQGRNLLGGCGGRGRCESTRAPASISHWPTYPDDTASAVRSRSGLRCCCPSARFVSEGLEEGQFQEADERLQQTIDDYRECVTAAEYYYEYADEDGEDVSGSAPTTVPPSPLHDGKSLGSAPRSTPLVTTTAGDSSCPSTPVRSRGLDAAGSMLHHDGKSPRRRPARGGGTRRKSEVYFSDCGSRRGSVTEGKTKRLEAASES